MRHQRVSLDGSKVKNARMRYHEVTNGISNTKCLQFFSWMVKYGGHRVRLKLVEIYWGFPVQFVQELESVQFNA